MKPIRLARNDPDQGLDSIDILCAGCSSIIATLDRPTASPVTRRAARS
jgi:hypothetical protein